MCQSIDGIAVDESPEMPPPRSKVQPIGELTGDVVDTVTDLQRICKSFTECSYRGGSGGGV